MSATRRSRQRGVAVVTAMLVVALGTITIVAITAGQQLDMQRERNEGFIQQARDFAASGERFAQVLLYRDRQEAARENTDSLDDDWAQTIPPVPIDNAAIQGCIVDLQGRFNLNNLVDAEGRAAPPFVEQLGRLFDELGVDRAKIPAVVDWLDTDIDPTGAEGAEDDYYSGLDVAYRAANGPFASVSELRLVKGFGTATEEEIEDYERLLPHVAALPPGSGRTAVNVNTATPEVIASLDPAYKAFATDMSRWETSAYEDYPECEDIFDLAAEAVETIEQERDLQPYLSVDQFVAEAGGEVVPGGNGNEGEPQGEAGDPGQTGEPQPGETAQSDQGAAPGVPLAVSSRFFEVRIDVLAEGLRLSQFALLERDDEGRTRIVRRSRDVI